METIDLTKLTYGKDYYGIGRSIVFLSDLNIILKKLGVKSLSGQKKLKVNKKIICDVEITLNKDVINFKLMKINSIISYYFTTAKDPQGREPIKWSDTEYIQKWYDSVILLGLQCILFHDGLSNEFIEHFDKMKFVQVPPVPKGMQLHDYHWTVSHNYLLRHEEIENVFFTDCPDVVVVKNPFEQPEYKPEVLYCGDEPQKMNESDFMRAALYNESLNKLPNFIELLSSGKTLYNGGVLGGNRDKVLEFTQKISELIEQVKFRRIDGTGDMALYNYVLHKYFNPVHGEPVNSVFKEYQSERKDVWFIHK